LVILQAFLGIVVLLAIALLFSENPRYIPWKVVISALVLQFVLAVLLLKFPASQQVFVFLNKLVEILEDSTRAGTSFVFGYLGGEDIPFKLKQDASASSTYILAFRGLPLVLVVSALSSLLFYWRILPIVVRFFAGILQRTLGIGGAEGVGISANIFLGMVESPLFVKHYLSRMQRGEIFVIMASGMATIAGTVMVLYASILKPVIPNAMVHLLIASILSAPAAIAVSRIMVPASVDKEKKAEIDAPTSANSSMEAITNGALEGVSLLLNILAMLIVLVALVALINNILGIFPDFYSQPLTLQRVLGWILAPIAWLIGIPWEESFTAGSLLGTKIVLNEFIAYTELSQLSSGAVSEETRLILSYALCGFANFGSLGIMLGGLGGIAPDRKGDIVSMGLKSIVAGTLATCMTGAVVGIIV